MSGPPGLNGAEVNTFAHFLLARGLSPAPVPGPSCKASDTIAGMARDPRIIRRDLLIRGLLLCFIGLVVLVSPMVIRAPGFAEAVGRSSVVGWFALVLGIVFVVQWLARRNRP